MSAKPFVPEDFDPPRELELPEFQLVPLGAQHNESDHTAWTSSIAHIRATPGLESWGWGWPPVEGMSLDAHRGDLERHARLRRARRLHVHRALAGHRGGHRLPVHLPRQGRRRRCAGPLLGSR